MARVAGVEIPNDKRFEFSLPYVYGIGRSRTRQIAEQIGVPLDTMVRDLTEEQLVRLRAVVEGEYTVEGDLRREVRQNIQRLIEINCYRGYRHRRGLPVRGQRTKTNARTRRGSRRTVAGKRRVARK
ncbi:MAG: 30S ribosomal protein S13 [Chloroflexi bacterium]|nr:30S ribosomal protein S13 [Chloroflexota bacterium]MYB41590.1 30S ribosomal protein S13 [Chloroflexota bacterium]MYE47354.1 30S ribosomal protein S13 [Chloroflexota bacterium]MYI81985.1 30S ribosomal protein S13 [Chloroflexota bacterium]